MKIAIELNQAQSERLESIAASLGVNTEELARAAGADDFQAAALRVLDKNRELYQRLNK